MKKSTKKKETSSTQVEYPKWANEAFKAEKEKGSGASIQKQITDALISDAKPKAKKHGIKLK